MKRTIKKVAVLGSGVMGSRIACHFAGVGLQTILLDMVPKGFEESTKPAERNKLVNDALAAAIKSNPSPVYTKDVVKKITTGNFTDNMKDIASCDWVIEVVVERLDIKQLIFEQVEKFRKPGTLITSNTSGIPIKFMQVEMQELEYYYSTAYGLSAKFGIQHKVFNPLDNIPGKENFSSGKGEALNNFETTAAIRFAYLERFLEGNYFRTSLGSDYPIVEFRYSHGWSGVLNSNYDYDKINLFYEMHFYNSNICFQSFFV